MQRLRNFGTEMVKEGLDLGNYLKMIIKIPCTPAGLSATNSCRSRDRCKRHTVFSVAQARCFQGRCFHVSFLGRLDDNGEMG